MAILRPFKAIRPKEEFACRIAALPYDVMDSAEARIMAKDNPYSFLHVDKAEIDLDENVNAYDKKVYQKARENLDKLIDDGAMVQDERPNLFIYRLVMNGRAQTGIVGCTSIDDYMNGVIKKHEHTREDKEADRIKHVDTCDAHTGPIFLTYRYNDKIDAIVKRWTRNEPVYNFVAEDGVAHIVWTIDDDETIEKVKTIFGGIESLYIADGHHRTASAVKVGLKRREQNPDYTGNEEFNYFLTVAFPDRDLEIMDYNRVVFDVNMLTKEEYIKLVRENFEMKIHEENMAYKPEDRHTYGMYYEGTWYKLRAKQGTFNNNDPVDRLDVSILQNNLLNPVLGIKDPRTDKRIDFVGGIRGVKELERRVYKNSEGVAFSMHPTTIYDLMAIADANKVMPPKSTWFEPKLRSGLFIHPLT
ncbi:MAG TPA: DUF1015 family protein [Clostridiaceae bacterium]|nr:DUF1015 family protein [Clostridiaceae bacterium]